MLKLDEEHVTQATESQLSLFRRQRQYYGVSLSILDNPKIVTGIYQC